VIAQRLTSIAEIEARICAEELASPTMGVRHERPRMKK
jgi:hypothetical protein